MSTKQLETISGTVSKVNSKANGIQINGDPEWLNVSQYRPVAVMPSPGELVEVQVERTDKGPWINSLRIIGCAPTAAAPATNRDRAIARMSALRSAAIFAGHKSTVTEDVKSADVLKIAEVWLEWLERKGNDAAN